MVGTYAERLGDNREERERRVEHISENLHEWIANGQRLKENNQKFFNDRVAGHYRQGDIPQIDWIESYIPLPKAKNIFLDAHHARNMPCGKLLLYCLLSHALVYVILLLAPFASLEPCSGEARVRKGIPW